jgi:hypothetical protein
VEDEAQIVVLARKLNKWTGRFSVKDGAFSCRTTRSTKDRELDALGCTALLQCAPALRAEITERDAKGTPRARRQALQAQITESLTACTREKRGDLLAELAQARDGQR